MKNQIYKDKNKRILNFTLDNKKFVLKSILKNASVSKLIAYNSNLNFTEFSKSYYSSVLVNRCVLTGRSKRAQRLFRVSRLAFLKNLRNGSIYGMTKSTW
jgi:ribosomal protein S14